MTIDELMALPIFHEFSTISVEVRRDGTAIAPNGTVLHGLLGTHVMFPVANPRSAFYVGADTPLTWVDSNGQKWQLVGTPNGLAREPVRVVTSPGDAWTER